MIFVLDIDLSEKTRVIIVNFQNLINIGFKTQIIEERIIQMTIHTISSFLIHPLSIENYHNHAISSIFSFFLYYNREYELKSQQSL